MSYFRLTGAGWHRVGRENFLSPLRNTAVICRQICGACLSCTMEKIHRFEQKKYHGCDLRDTLLSPLAGKELRSNMAVHGANREPHASSLTEFRPKMESVSSIQRRARCHHRKDYAYRCSFVPLLLILTLVTGLTKLTFNRSQRFVDISDCFLFVGDLTAHRSHNTTQWSLSSQGAGRLTAYFMPVSAQPPECSIQPLSQLVSNPLTTIPSLSMAVKPCAPPPPPPPPIFPICWHPEVRPMFADYHTQWWCANKPWPHQVPMPYLPQACCQQPPRHGMRELRCVGTH